MQLLHGHFRGEVVGYAFFEIVKCASQVELEPRFGNLEECLLEATAVVQCNATGSGNRSEEFVGITSSRRNAQHGSTRGDVLENF